MGVLLDNDVVCTGDNIPMDRICKTLIRYQQLTCHPLTKPLEYRFFKVQLKIQVFLKEDFSRLYLYGWQIYKAFPLTSKAIAQR